MRQSPVQPVRSSQSEPDESKTLSVFAQNLKSFIGDASVNSWAEKYKLEQTTIQRILNGQDTKVSMVEKIAEKLDIPVWCFFVPGVNLKNPPIIKGAGGKTEELLYKRIDSLIESLSELKDGGSTRPGNL